MEQFLIQPENPVVLYGLQGIPDGIGSKRCFHLRLSLFQVTHARNENVVGISLYNRFQTQFRQQAAVAVCNIDAAERLQHTPPP